MSEAEVELQRLLYSAKTSFDALRYFDKIDMNKGIVPCFILYHAALFGDCGENQLEQALVKFHVALWDRRDSYSMASISCCDIVSHSSYTTPSLPPISHDHASVHFQQLLVAAETYQRAIDENLQAMVYLEALAYLDIQDELACNAPRDLFALQENPEKLSGSATTAEFEELYLAAQRVKADQVDIDPEAFSRHLVVQNAEEQAYGALQFFETLDPIATFRLLEALGPRVALRLHQFLTSTNMHVNAPNLDFALRIQLARASNNETLVAILKRPGDPAALAHLHVHLVFVDHVVAMAGGDGIASLGPNHPWKQIAATLNALTVSPCEPFSRVKAWGSAHSPEFNSWVLPEDTSIRGFRWAE